jgi:hypothetical protein
MWRRWSISCTWTILAVVSVTASPIPESIAQLAEPELRYAKLGELFKTLENTQTTFDRLDMNNVVKVNNTEELTDFIRNFVKQNSFKNAKSDHNINNSDLLSRPLPSQEKVSLDTLGSIRERLSDFLSDTDYAVPKAFVSAPTETQEEIKEKITRIIKEQEKKYESTRTSTEATTPQSLHPNDRLKQQMEIIQKHVDIRQEQDNSSTDNNNEEIIEVYINGNLQNPGSDSEIEGSGDSSPISNSRFEDDKVSSHQSQAFGPVNNVPLSAYTNNPPRTPNTPNTPNSQISPSVYRPNPQTSPNSQQSISQMAAQEYYASEDYYEYDEYDLDTDDSGSHPKPSLAQAPQHQLIASNALTSLNALFKQHLPNAEQSAQSGQESLIPLELLSQLQQTAGQGVPESETLNIILTPNTNDQAYPNIAILPTSDLPRISPNISRDIGVDIESILNSLAGSASRIRNQPMIVEENHTQLIKQPGMPTKLKVKETMSEILGNNPNPHINVLSNREEENSFHDLDSLIREVTGEASPLLPPSMQNKQSMPKSAGGFDDQLKLNVSTKTNIVNIFAFNIYPSGTSSPSSEEMYELKDFAPLGTSIKTQAHVHLQPPGQTTAHIQSQYQYESKPTNPPVKKTTNDNIDKILGAVLLSQLEGGGSDRVIEALGQNPEMMQALLNSNPVTSTTTRTTLGLYPDGVDSGAEYAPGPYGLIARNNALEKIILAMKQDIGTAGGVKDLDTYVNMMEGTPEYAQLLLANQMRERSDDKAPLGPLGYSVSSETKTSPNTGPNKVSPAEFLKAMGGSATAALMAGAVATYPYWLPLLAGKKRRRKRFVERYGRGGNPEISTDWLALLTGSKYASTENTDKRMNNWVTKEKDKTLEKSQNIDDIVLGHELSDRVRVQLNDKNKADIMDWREKQKQKVEEKPESATKKPNPEFYTNYYPMLAQTDQKLSTQDPTASSTIAAIAKSTTQSSSTVPDISTKAKNAVRKRSTQRTTKKYYSTTPKILVTSTPSKSNSNPLKSADTSTILPDSLLFWTTPRPKLTFRRTTKRTKTSTSSFLWFTAAPTNAKTENPLMTEKDKSQDSFSQFVKNLSPSTKNNKVTRKTTTKKTSKTTQTSNSKKYATTPKPLLFYTTTPLPSTTTTSSKTNIKGQTASTSFLWFTTTKSSIKAKIPAKTTTIKTNKRRKTVRPTSSFLWFTKSPKNKSTKSPIIREDDLKLKAGASNAWWKPSNLPKPTNIKTLSAFLLDSSSTTSTVRPTSRKPTNKSTIRNSTTKKLKVKVTTTKTPSKSTTANDWNDLLLWSNKYAKPTKSTDRDSFKPNFNNGYSYNVPITRTPPDKVSWEQKFKPVKVTPLSSYQTETRIQVSNDFEYKKKEDGKIDDSFFIDDVRPKSSLTSYDHTDETAYLKEMMKPVSSLNKVQEKIELPKWPYVENLWKNVDKIVGDLITEEEILNATISDNIIDSNLDSLWKDLEVDTSGLGRFDTDSLSEEEKSDEEEASYYPIEKVTEEPDQAYWQELKRKHGFISAHTDMYPEKPSTFKPELAFLQKDSLPQYYHANIPNLNKILYEKEIESANKPELVKSNNEISFDLTDQPLSMPYAKNPSILVARRNISSSSDILNYLSQLMNAANDLKDQNDEAIDGIDRDTTTRTFFKPDLLQDNANPLPLLQGLEKLQQSLINYKDPENNPDGDFNIDLFNDIYTEDDNNWLTAEDILNAADDSDSQYTHSPIVLIPYNDSMPASNIKLPDEVYKHPFTIFDTLSPAQTSSGDEEIISDRDKLVSSFLTSLKSTNTITQDEDAQEHTEKLKKKNIVKMDHFEKRPKFPINEGSLATAEPFSVLSDWGLSETSLESSVPKEKTVQSSPIKTVITDKVMEGIMKKNEETSNLFKHEKTTKSTLSIVNEKLNATSFAQNLNKMTILDTPTSQLKIFEDKAKTSEKELISFIQKLMEQAEKEQGQKSSHTNSLPNSNTNSFQQVVPLQLKPLLTSNEPSEGIKHSLGKTEHSEGDTELVGNLDYNHVWDSATTRSTTSRKISNEPTTTTKEITSTPTLKPLKTTVRFSPIPIETFPKINLEDFVSPTSLDLSPGKEKTKEVKKRVSDVPILPFRTTLRTTTTTTTTQKPTTTTDGSPSGVITRLLSEAAAPIVGLSAATLAYSAAAMLPVWLPLALGGRRKRSASLDLLHYEVSQGLSKVDSLDR